MCFFFSSGICFSVFFWDIWGLKRPHIFGEKKKNKKKSTRKRLGKGTLNTCAKFQGLTLKNDVGIWTVVRLSAKITAWHRIHLILVYIRFWALNLT